MKNENVFGFIIFLKQKIFFLINNPIFLNKPLIHKNFDIFIGSNISFLHKHFQINILPSYFLAQKANIIGVGITSANNSDRIDIKSIGMKMNPVDGDIFIFVWWDVVPAIEIISLIAFLPQIILYSHE